MLFAVLLLAGFCLAYIFMCRIYFPKVNEKIPSYPGQLPVLGHLPKLLFTCISNVDGAYKFFASLSNFAIQNDGVTKLMLGPIPAYIVADPEDIQTVLNRCLEKPKVYRVVHPLLGTALIAADVPTWKRNRRILDLGFKQHLIDEYLEVFIEQADVLAQKLEEEVGRGEVDLIYKVARIILESSCQTTLGDRPNGIELLYDEYMRAGHEYFDIMAIRVWMPWLLIEPIYNMSSYKERSMKAVQTVNNFTDEMVRLRKSEYLLRLKNKETFDYTNRRFKSILDIFIENSVTETSSLHTHEELRNLVDNVLFAAFDTSVIEMMFALVCIGSFPAVQDKIYEEISRILPEGTKVCKENISEFIYLEAAIKEALRLYPVAMVVARQTTYDTKLRNVTIPANSSVIVHLWSANRNPKYWGSDANEFKPERWLSPNTPPEHPAAFASFSPGRRGCLGKNYALLSMKAAFIAILRKYKLTADHTRLKIDLHVMVKPHSGHFVKVERR